MKQSRKRSRGRTNRNYSKKNRKRSRYSHKKYSKKLHKRSNKRSKKKSKKGGGEKTVARRVSIEELKKFVPNPHEMIVKFNDLFENPPTISSLANFVGTNSDEKGNKQKLEARRYEQFLSWGPMPKKFPALSTEGDFDQKKVVKALYLDQEFTSSKVMKILKKHSKIIQKMGGNIRKMLSSLFKKNKDIEEQDGGGWHAVVGVVAVIVFMFLCIGYNIWAAKRTEKREEQDRAQAAAQKVEKEKLHENMLAEQKIIKDAELKLEIAKNEYNIDSAREKFEKLEETYARLQGHVFEYSDETKLEELKNEIRNMILSLTEKINSGEADLDEAAIAAREQGLRTIDRNRGPNFGEWQRQKLSEIRKSDTKVDTGTEGQTPKSVREFSSRFP